MPRIAPELSALDVKRLSHSGGKFNAMYAVGGVFGLYMQITPLGSKSWILRATVGTKRRDIGLGSYPDVTLSQARERARELKDQVWRGFDPIEQRKAARSALAEAQKRSMSFAEAFDGYAEAKLPELGSDEDRVRWRSSINRYALPHIGDQPVDGLKIQDILRVLEPVWYEKTETASRVRARIEAILSWSTVAGHRTGDNPARWKGNLDTLLPNPGRIKEVKHHPAVPLADAHQWFAELHKCGGTAARGLEFLAICAVRSGNVRAAEWNEIDRGARIWTISADKMKGVGGQRRELRVPLPDAALNIIDTMPKRIESPYIFAAPRGGMMSDMTISAVMRRMQATAEAKAEKAGRDIGKAGWRDAQSGRPAVPHGLRSTFRDWAAERTDYPSEMAEIALAHKVGNKVERAYRRGHMVEKRRQMMADWADFLGAEG